ncbi:MAG: HU family DNA-binding protein [Candidatus Helarchaeota archaeon]|nr:HU family DNA-binding protein [Candidatus Helarchaeota archaeon]
MNKGGLINEVAKKTGLSKKNTIIVVNGLLDAIKSGVKKGSVRLSGFGTFALVRRKARKGRNPRTGETITIKSRNTVKFRPGKGFKA